MTLYMNVRITTFHFLVFNVPWVTVGVGVTIPPLRDEVKPDEALVEKIVLLVRVGGGSTLVSM